MRKQVCCVFLMLLLGGITTALTGCGKPPLEEALVGRWFETKEQRLYEFSSSGLYGVSSNDAPVEIGQWSVQDGTLTMKSIAGPLKSTTEQWRVDMSDDSFDVSVNEAFYRRFERSKDSIAPADERIVGLWRKDGKYTHVVEFTKSGGVLGFMWRRQKDRSLVLMGLFGRVSCGAGELTIHGSMGSQTMLPTAHRYTMENEKLLWRAPKKEHDVFRRVQLQDVDLTAPK